MKESTNMREEKREKSVGVKLKILTFYERFDPDEYLQYERKFEHIFNRNNFTEERKLKLAVAEFCVYAIIWWTSLKSEWWRNYKEPIEMWEELKTLMRKRYIPMHYEYSSKNSILCNRDPKVFKNII